jgi:hypothetical protein
VRQLQLALCSNCSTAAAAVYTTPLTSLHLPQVTVKLSDLFPEEGAPPPIYHLPAGSLPGRKLAQHTTSTASARQLLSAPTAAAAAAHRKLLGTSSASVRGIDLEEWRDKASPKDRESLDTLTGGTSGRQIEPSPALTLSSIPRGRRMLMGLGGVPPSRRALLGSSAGSLETWIAGASAENQQAAKALGASSGSSKSDSVKISDLDLDH